MKFGAASVKISSITVVRTSSIKQLSSFLLLKESYSSLVNVSLLRWWTLISCILWASHIEMTPMTSLWYHWSSYFKLSSSPLTHPKTEKASKMHHVLKNQSSDPKMNTVSLHCWLNPLFSTHSNYQHVCCIHVAEYVCVPCTDVWLQGCVSPTPPSPPQQSAPHLLLCLAERWTCCLSTWLTCLHSSGLPPGLWLPPIDLFQETLEARRPEIKKDCEGVQRNGAGVSLRSCLFFSVAPTWIWNVWKHYKKEFRV